MLRRLNELTGYTISADEQIGNVDDFYFDENTWTVRYMVVNTGSWLSENKVLLSTVALSTPDWINLDFPVNLTRKQVENAPSIDLAKPVSRQQETELSDYFGWPMYWLAATGAATGATATGNTGAVAPVAATPIGVALAEESVTTNQEAATSDKQTHHSVNLASTQETSSKPLLRSVKEVVGYHITANDGDIGHVEDFFADDVGWGIHYMLVDTRNWLPGREVLVAPQWTHRVSWDESKVHVDMTREQIEKSPEYHSTAPLDRDYEKKLHHHYGRSIYWQ